MKKEKQNRVSPLLRLTGMFMGLLAPLAAQAGLEVVATLPDLAAVAREIGGERVSVTALAKPSEDPHFVDAKPSFIVKLNRADALIEGGAELETGWLPPLLEGGRNPKLQIGAPGRVVASEGIQLLDVPANVSRAMGDIHALGNPHFMVDPLRAKIVAGHIADAFAKLDPGSAAIYQANFKKFSEALDRKMPAWTKTLAPFRGQSLVAYHDSWVYFAERFGFHINLFLEPKPGLSPSPSHLATVIEKMKAGGIKVILVEPFHDRKIAEAVASHTGARVVDFAQYPGAFPNTETYIALMDTLVSRLAAALTAH